MTQLRILFLDDNPHETEQAVQLLSQRGIGCDWLRVETLDEVLTTLAQHPFDLLLIDFNLPALDGISAVRQLRRRGINLPCILLSTTAGEELAIESLKAGASDYVLRSRLERLPEQVQQLLNATRERLSQPHLTVEQRSIEQQLIQHEQRESLGLLMSGIAHDLNNLLTAVLGNTQLVLEFARADDPNLVYLQEIEHATGRARTLISQLLALSRRQQLERMLIDLHALLDELQPLLQLLGGGITIQLQPAHEPLRVAADRQHLTQALLTVMLALCTDRPATSEIHIRPYSVQFEHIFDSQQAWPRNGHFVVLEFFHASCDFCSERQRQIFEPFLSASQGRARSLELASVQNLVKHYRGQIEVEQTDGQGLRLRIYLPAYSEQQRIENEETAPAPTGGNETLLLVDDEDALRWLAADGLRRLGYRVLLAADGREALQIFERYAEQLKLVILDLRMPQVNAQVVLAQMRNRQPSLPCLLMCGYLDEQTRHELEQARQTGLPVLHKPFGFDTLGRAVRHLLDGRSSLD